MRGSSKEAVKIFLRYIFLVLIAIPGFDIAYNFIYAIFLPLTEYPSFHILSLIFNTSISGNIILIGPYAIEIIGACVATSAYSLLLILNLATPGINTISRVRMILFSFMTFLLINIARIVILSVMYVNESPFFEIVHEILWVAGSTLIVVGIWFLSVKIFKVKGIPFYSDVKGLYKKSILKKR